MRRKPVVPMEACRCVCLWASGSWRSRPLRKSKPESRAHPGLGRVRRALEETLHLDLTRLESESGFGLDFDPILGVPIQGF